MVRIPRCGEEDVDFLINFYEVLPSSVLPGETRGYGATLIGLLLFLSYLQNRPDVPLVPPSHTRLSRCDSSTNIGRRNSAVVAPRGRC